MNIHKKTLGIMKIWWSKRFLKISFLIFVSYLRFFLSCIDLSLFQLWWTSMYLKIFSKNIVFRGLFLILNCLHRKLPWFFGMCFILPDITQIKRATSVCFILGTGFFPENYSHIFLLELYIKIENFIKWMFNKVNLNLIER